MYYKQKYIESIETLKSNINGLSSDEAKKRLEEHGYNELKEGVKVPTWKLFLESFTDPLVIILLIGIDQLIKNWALNVLRYKGAISVIENVFNLTYVENRGAAFGLFQNNQIIFIVVALIASIVGLYALHSKKINSKICKTSIMLIIAGALGNLIDRIRLDFVVDYFDFVFIWNYVFNLADCFIVVGTILLCLYVLIKSDKTEKK